jgi:PIN domain nuclease of toxin-antitoxin system
LRVLADTGVWFRFVRRLPLPKKIETVLADGETERYLSPISSMELIRKWQSGKLPCPDPGEWLDQALQGFEILPITEPIARLAAEFDWIHRDPADRLIAASAEQHGIELWHTDTILQKLTGFPHRYFKGITL